MNAKYKQIKLSLYKNCIDEYSMNPIPKKELKIDGPVKYIDGAIVNKMHHTTYGSKFREFVIMRFGGIKYYADKYTGSLYHFANGSCISSPHMRIEV